MASPNERQEPVTDEFDDDIHEVPSHTPDFRTELAEDLARLVPEAVADGRIDVEKLRELLDEDAAHDGRERFGLMWPGKSRALKAAQAPTTATLVPDRENSQDWDATQNVFIEGDNLEVLKILQKHYHGKIKMIYIDPPYNTGNDFIYPDNYREGLQTYLEWTKQVSADGKKLSSNPESAGRYHSNWLNMMYPRLKVARNLLSHDGAIFVSIDDTEHDNLRKLLKEVFGESNEIGTMCVVRSEGGGLARQIVKGHDYLLGFAKDINDFKPILRQKIVRGKVVKIDDEEYQIEEDWLRKEFGKYGTCLYEDIVEVFGPKKKAEIDKGLSEGKFVLIPKKAGHIVGRYRKIDGDGSKFHSVNKFLNRDGVRELRELGGMDVFFSFPKPLALIEALVRGMTIGSQDKEFLVLDFFSGSATTAHAVTRINAEDGGSHNFIQVQLPEPVDPESEAGIAGFGTIADIARERIRRAGQQISEEFGDQLSTRESPLDVGFRTYKLAGTSFVKWRETSSADQNALEKRLAGLRGSADDNANPEMLLTELLLKQGYSLTESLSETEIAGLKVWSVADGAMLAIMDEHVKPALEQLRAVVESGPVRLVILEDVFAGDDQLKTNLVQHARTHGVELWSA